MKRLIPALAALVLAAPAFAAGTLADVTIFDRGARRLLPVHWSDGQAFVAGAPGNEYAIRIRNRSSDDLLAVVSVDGVNVVTGADCVARAGRLRDPGPRLPRDQGLAQEPGADCGLLLHRPGRFLRRAHRPAGQRRRDRRGAVQAQAGAAGSPSRRERWRRQATFAPRRTAPRAARRAAKAQERAAAEPQLGTGHGRSEASYARYVQFERESDAPNEVVTIRYDSRANLIALGVIPAPGRRRATSPIRSLRRSCPTRQVRIRSRS